ncbi:MAG: hypothetical protein ABIH42_02830 [Planctomycetota bacterium]
MKITDKNQRHGIKTKNVLMIGYPSVIFCTAGLSIDEQEATRFLLLSPEVSQPKIVASVQSRIKRESDPSKYREWLENNPDWQHLKLRIKAIKESGIGEVKISELDQEKIEQMFFERNQRLKPRDTRDIKRILSLIKSFALLNFWFREWDGNDIITKDEDIENAFMLWDAISESQQYNLPPYIYDFYRDVLLSAFNEKNASDSELTVKKGLIRQDIIHKHYEFYGRHLPDWQLRQQIIPMLETCGLIYQEPDNADKRRILIYPTTQLTISDNERYSELDPGVGDNDDNTEEEL